MDRKSVRTSCKKQRKALKEEYKTKKRSLRASYSEAKTSLTEDFYRELDRITCERCGRQPQNPPKRSELEEIGNSVTHCVGAVFSAAAFFLMCCSASSPAEYVGAALYSFGLISMFTMSCLYHALPYGSGVKRVFRRFDYSGIYLLIGATFAPIILSYIGGSFGFAFLIIQWTVIALGITLVGVCGPSRLRFIHIPLYVILGWCGLVFLPEMIRRCDYAFLCYILGGGIVYSIGIIPFALKRRAAHFVWHVFVLFGAVIQWLGVYLTIYLR